MPEIDKRDMRIPEKLGKELIRRKKRTKTLSMSQVQDRLEAKRNERI